MCPKNNIPSPDVVDTIDTTIPGDFDLELSFSDDSLSSWILNSTLYKQAYEIFVSDQRYGHSFLVSLEAIPYARALNDETLGGKIINTFGGNSAREKQKIAYFNEAMTEIRELVNRYYQFISSLPIEQSAQLMEAGINSAITGEGLTASSVDRAGMVTPTQPASDFSDTDTIMNGFNSVLNVFSSIASLGTSAVGIASTLSTIDIAKRSAYNSQEVHDVNMAGLGVTTSSPYRVLTPLNTPSINKLSGTASDVQSVNQAVASADASVLDSEHQVSVGTDPNNVASFEVMTGREILSAAAALKMSDMFAQKTINAVRSAHQAASISFVAALEQNYKISEMERGISEQDFTRAYFDARNGSIEGKTETDLIQESLTLQRLEAGLKRYENWYSKSKMDILKGWSEDMKNNPLKTPYYLAAMFGFNMADTVFHYNAATMGVHYGLDILDQSVGIVGNIVDMFDNSDKSTDPEKPKADKDNRSASIKRKLLAAKAAVSRLD